MFEHNNFVDIFLVLALLGLFGLWFYQNNNKYMSYNMLKNTFSQQNNNNITDNINNNTLSTNEGLITNDIEFPQEHNRTRLLTNQRGITVGFHERFKRWLPELGWRSFYLRNFNGLNNLENDNKSRTSIDNYLSCLTNIDNVYKYVNY